MNINQIINSAYHFEVAKIETNSTAWNPHHDTIMGLKNGEAIWEAVNVMVESYMVHRKEFEELVQLTKRYYKHCKHLEDIVWKQSGEIDYLKRELFKGKDNPEDDLPF